MAAKGVVAGAVGAVVGAVVGKLGDILIQEAILLGGVREQVEWIKRELSRMQCFIKDAEEKQKKDDRVKNWVKEIRDVCYDAEDIIDAYVAQSRGEFVGCVNWNSCNFGELKSLHKFGKRLERIKSTISDISQSRLTYGIRDINEEGQVTSPSKHNLHEHRRLSALFEEPDTVGLQEDMNTLVTQLIHGDLRRCVISVVGMGGSGKTTLAKKVCNCSDIKRHFNYHAFIHLSQEYSMREIMIQIITSVMGLSQAEAAASSDDDLTRKLINHLSMNRYLVVIDDIWSNKAWEALKVLLPDGSNGSRVMLTTRNREVALHADPLSQIHLLRLLNDKESWELFMKRVFPGRNASTACPSQMEGIGKQIVAKCGGLPLAIVVLGSLLSKRRETSDAWSKVLDSVNWQLAQGSNHCMEILALSYIDLPHCLKPCFLYLGLFPEDHEIRLKKLIQLWIAEGFVQPRGDETMEDVAEDYLEELINRSMIEVARKGSDGLPVTYRIHDLVRDLSISEAKEGKFFEINTSKHQMSLSKNVRRVAIHHSTDPSSHISSDTPFLRSILCFAVSKMNLSKLLANNIKLLRVLDLEGVHIPRRKIPKEIGQLVHLRYLNLACTGVYILPSSIGNLGNLQTLILALAKLSVKGSRPIGHLPKAIWNFGSLRHLQAYEYKINGRPQLNNLQNLQSLHLDAGSWIKHVLDKLTNLRNLGICGDLRAYHVALSNSIKKLDSLRSFSAISGKSIPPLMSFSHHLHLHKIYLDGRIEKLPEFPPNLSQLILMNSLLEQDAITTLEKLSSLRILKLRVRSYCRKVMVFHSEGFPRLEFLELEDLDQIESWIVEEKAMPNLTHFAIYRFHGTKFLPERLRSLSELMLALVSINEKQEIQAEDWKSDFGLDQGKTVHDRIDEEISVPTEKKKNFPSLCAAKTDSGILNSMASKEDIELHAELDSTRKENDRLSDEITELHDALDAERMNFNFIFFFFIFVIMVFVTYKCW